MSSKFKIILTIIGAGLLVCGLLTYQGARISRLQEETRRLASNADALLTDLEHYVMRDSIHVVRAKALEFTIDELEAYRAEDAKIIQDLGVKNRDLEAMLRVSSATIRELEGRVADTVIVTQTKRDTLKRITYDDRWIDLDFVLRDDGAWQGRLEHRLDLAVVLETRYKRFLGFLWRTKHVDHQEVQVTAPEDPYTTINDVSLIKVEKE